MSNNKAAWIVWRMFASWLPRRVCVCAWVVSVGMFVWWWVLHHHTKKIESGSVWYVFYMRTMYVQFYMIWYIE